MNNMALDNARKAGYLKALDDVIAKFADDEYIPAYAIEVVDQLKSDYQKGKTE